MKNLLHSLLTATCAIAFLAGCGDSGGDKKTDGKSPLDAVLKLAGDNVGGDYKAVIDKLVELAPGILAGAKSEGGIASSLSNLGDAGQWGKLVSQLQDFWSKAKPAERDQIKAYAETAATKLKEGEERNTLLTTLTGLFQAGGE